MVLGLEATEGRLNGERGGVGCPLPQIKISSDLVFFSPTTPSFGPNGRIRRQRLLQKSPGLSLVREDPLQIPKPFQEAPFRFAEDPITL